MSFCERKTHPWSDTSWRRQFLWIRGTFCCLFFTHPPFLRFLPQTGVGPTQFRVHVPGTCLKRRCSALPFKGPAWGPSLSLPHSLVIKPGKGQRGSPWSFSVVAAQTENSKERGGLSVGGSGSGPLPSLATC